MTVSKNMSLGKWGSKQKMRLEGEETGLSLVDGVSTADCQTRTPAVIVNIPSLGVEDPVGADQALRAGLKRLKPSR